MVWRANGADYSSRLQPRQPFQSETATTALPLRPSEHLLGVQRAKAAYHNQLPRGPALTKLSAEDEASERPNL